MSMQVSDTFTQLVNKARWSHAHGRDIFHITQDDVDAGRLFSYAYRSQTIGAFHGTRVALEAAEKGGVGSRSARSFLHQARSLLKQLEDKAIELVPRDYRVVISTLYYYDELVNLVIQSLDKACSRGPNPTLETIRQRFLDNLQPVHAGNGIFVAQDVTLPEQGVFIVPNLGISIKPVIYGDYHSWNAAFLAGDQYGVSTHRHHKGAEIHLGFSPVQGHAVLRSGFAEVSEGYAMPIPPMTDHGFRNTIGHDHVVPFIFGSLPLTGWGVFFDVEPRPGQGQLVKHDLDSPAMNHSVYLERELRRVREAKTNTREVLIPAERAGSPEIGGLELAVTLVGRGEVDLLSNHYRIVSIQAGKAHVRIGNAEKEVCAHDHFGVPADMTCQVAQSGNEPLLFLDAMILPITNT